MKPLAPRTRIGPRRWQIFSASVVARAGTASAISGGLGGEELDDGLGVEAALATVVVLGAITAGEVALGRARSEPVGRVAAGQQPAGDHLRDPALGDVLLNYEQTSRAGEVGQERLGNRVR